jgi:hypothetical protein
MYLLLLHEYNIMYSIQYYQRFHIDVDWFRGFGALQHRST